MDDRERSVSDEFDYQLATRFFASAFEHCDRLPTEDQQSLLGEISNQIIQTPRSGGSERKIKSASAYL